MSGLTKTDKTKKKQKIYICESLCYRPREAASNDLRTSVTKMGLDGFSLSAGTSRRQDPVRWGLNNPLARFAAPNRRNWPLEGVKHQQVWPRTPHHTVQVGQRQLDVENHESPALSKVLHVILLFIVIAIRRGPYLIKPPNGGTLKRISNGA